MVVGSDEVSYRNGLEKVGVIDGNDSTSFDEDVGDDDDNCIEMTVLM